VETQVPLEPSDNLDDPAMSVNPDPLATKVPLVPSETAVLLVPLVLLDAMVPQDLKVLPVPLVSKENVASLV
jgi:hypothetical protein